MTTLNEAKKVGVGSLMADRVYAGTTKVWELVLVDPATAAYMAASGLDSSFQPVIDALVVGLKSKGLWAKMKAVYPFVGGTEALHRWNLVDPRDVDAAYRLTFTGPYPTHSAAAGYKPNPSPDYSLGWADTHVVPAAALDPYSVHMSLYSLTALGGAPRCDMGMYNWDGSQGRFHLICHYTSGEYYYTLGHGGVQNVPQPGAGDGSGMFVSSRTASDLEVAYRNGAAVGSNANVASISPAVPIYVGALNGYQRECSDMSFGFASIGSGLSAQNVADLYTLVEAYQTALGRAV
jgi:hypothetical protein